MSLNIFAINLLEILQVKVTFIFLLIFNFLFALNVNKFSHWLGLFDYPDKNRKKHKRPVSLLGGSLFISLLIIIFINFIFEKSLFFKIFNFSYSEFVKFLLFCIVVFLLGLSDDKIDVNANKKLIFLLLILLFYLNLDKTILITDLKFSFSEKSFSLGGLAIPFTILSILLFVNAFNMFDGINLQCGLYSFFIFIILLIYNNYYLLTLFILIQLFFYLYLNYKNQIFLGDSGSLLLGFIISILMIKSYNLNSNFLKADQIFLLMMIPGLDLLRLAIQRIVKKKHPFTADRKHLHHYLISKVGFFKTTLITQSLIIVPFLINIFFGNIYLIIPLVLIIYAIIVIKLY
jgi:UDP-GlcNAc:undecaprenyl-phosphate GlcNAc-1-phosphate transferase